MSGRPLPGTLFQIGYVVPNLDAALTHLNSKLGAPRFMVLREIVVENGWFRGAPAVINHSMAFGYVGDVQYEVIEPVAGKST
jgi:methylmalonyl-CoA/ethylmalonyl-CoA epimerase